MVQTPDRPHPRSSGVLEPVEEERYALCVQELPAHSTYPLHPWLLKFWAQSTSCCSD